jgi:hypothetical protein
VIHLVRNSNNQKAHCLRYDRRNHSRSRGSSCGRSRSRNQDRRSYQKPFKYTTETRKCYRCHKYGHLAKNCLVNLDKYKTEKFQKISKSGNFKRRSSSDQNKVHFCANSRSLAQKCTLRWTKAI